MMEVESAPAATKAPPDSEPQSEQVAQDREQRQGTLARWLVRVGRKQAPLERGGGEEATKDTAILDKQTQAVIQSLVQLSLRHEAELGRLRSESAFLFFMDSPENPELGITPRIKQVAQEWSALFAAGTVKTPLRTLLLMAVVRELNQRLAQFLTCADRCEKAMTVGWLCEGHNALDPLWTYWGWNPREKRTDQMPVKTTEIQAQLSVLEGNIAKEGVLLNCRCAKDLEETEVEVYPFQATVGFRSAEANATHRTLQMLSRCTVCKLIGARIRPERRARQPVAKQLEENYLWQPSTVRGRGEAGSEKSRRRMAVGWDSWVRGGPASYEHGPQIASSTSGTVGQYW